jgi:carbonic anhydrase
MIEIIWQYDPTSQEGKPAPATANEACRLLESGNRDFAELLAKHHEMQNARKVIKIYPENLRFSDSPGSALKQTPFAAVLSCADARVPTELVFLRAANDIFAVRVAGNVLASACLGSLDYAVENLESVRLLVVLGHTGCGAVTAAVDAMQKHTNYIKVAVNQPLRVIIDSLMAVVISAENALQKVYGPQATQEPGYRSALIASIIQKTYADLISKELQVVYGIYNLHNRIVGRPAGDSDLTNWESGLFSPPEDEGGIAKLSDQLARSEFTQILLAGKGD